MGWLGSIAGMYLGSHVGGILGGIIGAVLGGKLEEKLKGAAKESAGDGEACSSRRGENRELVTLTALAAMFAKMAKADGRVSRDEIAACERAFGRLGLSNAKRDYCVKVFRRAKDDNHTIYEYAQDYARCQRSIYVREFVYDILWELAASDGVLHQNELAILRQIISPLRIRETYYAFKAAEYGIGGSRSRWQRSYGGNSHASGESGPDPYEVLGVKRSDDLETIRKVYRAKAKRFHPDTLRRNGLSEEMMGRATEQMVKINAAWDAIKRERGG